MQNPWQRFQQDFHQKKVLVFGLGRQGGGVKVAHTLQRAGAQVRVYDRLPAEELDESLAQLGPDIEGELGTNDPDLYWPDFVIKNPAVPFAHPSIQAFLQQGVPVVGESALAVQYLRDHCIGITGTRGKTTTTTLIYELLSEAGRPVLVGGNIPQAPALSLLPEVEEETWMVLELSSFQLESFPFTKTSPHVAVLTNIYPDHLNRYESLAQYAQTKAEIFAYQQPTDIAIYGGSQEWWPVFESKMAAGVAAHRIDPEWIQEVRSRYRTLLPGEHNWENIATAAAVAQTLQIPENALQSVLDRFRGVPYRLQSVAQKDGIEFINDTTSTTPVALAKALAAYPASSFVLIAGGATKHLPFPDELLSLLQSQPKAIILLDGSGTKELLAALSTHTQPLPPIERVETLAEATQRAWFWAKQENVERILFSPGFTSFESFKNEFDRGEAFNTAVDQLGT